MEHFNKIYCIEVAGDYACFTRPEMKVERVSYDLITPSAARGIFQSIFWKPAIRWIIKKVEVLNEIQWISVRRNELGTIMSNRTGIFIEDNRQQRAGLFLRDVRYRIHAELEFIPSHKRPKTIRTVSAQLCRDESADEMYLVGGESHKDENPGKYYAIFERRAGKGQCFLQPYLGCREFSCSSFRLVENLENEPAPKEITKDLGFMLYDLDYSDGSNPSPAFFRAELHKGVMTIPDWESEEVRR